MKSLLVILTLVVTLGAIGMVNAQDYVGPERCLQCHNNSGLGDMTGWRSSFHANGYSYVPDDAHSLQDLLGVVADSDQNGVDDFKDGLDFNTINSAFDAYKPNAPILAYSAENGYTIQMGDVVHKVYMTYGGSGTYKQRYMIKINTSEGESAGHYISPVQYNDVTDQYVTYHPEDWYDGNNLPIYTPTSTLMDAAGSKRSMQKGCSGCHMTGLALEQDMNGEWIAQGAPVQNEADYADYNNIYDLDGDGDLDQINTTCEKCHGPGGSHAMTGNPAEIINPAKLTAEESNNLCGMCHNRGKSLPNNTFGFPFDDENLVDWSVGDMVADFFTDGGGDWPDGKHSIKHRQQYLDFVESNKPTFQFHKVTCYECHDVHNEQEHHIREVIVEHDSLGNDLPIATTDDDNTLCLSCHATHGAFAEIPTEWVADPVTNRDNIAAVVIEHTKHPYDPENSGLSRCSSCHNPKTAKSAVAYDITSHTFEPIPPRKTILFQNDGNGMLNACAVSCHMQEGLTFGIDFSNDNFTAWNEPADLALADTLLYYYGPSGAWWVDSLWVPTAIEYVSNEIPATFTLSQNYPNPFNPSTTIAFELPDMANIKLAVYNILGQEVAVLAKGIFPAGHYESTFEGADLPSGMYVYRLQSKGVTLSKKMVLMK